MRAELYTLYRLILCYVIFISIFLKIDPTNRITQTRELGKASYKRSFGDFEVGEEGKGVLGTENGMGEVCSKRRY